MKAREAWPQCQDYWGSSCWNSSGKGWEPAPEKGKSASEKGKGKGQAFKGFAKGREKGKNPFAGMSREEAKGKAMALKGKAAAKGKKGAVSDQKAAPPPCEKGDAPAEAAPAKFGLVSDAGIKNLFGKLADEGKPEHTKPEEKPEVEQCETEGEGEEEEDDENADDEEMDPPADKAGLEGGPEKPAAEAANADLPKTTKHYRSLLSKGPRVCMHASLIAVSRWCIRYSFMLPSPADRHASSSPTRSTATPSTTSEGSNATYCPKSLLEFEAFSCQVWDPGARPRQYPSMSPRIVQMLCTCEPGSVP